jgi:cytidine deaminase
LITSDAKKRARVGQTDRIFSAICCAKALTIHNRASTGTYPVRAISPSNQNAQGTAPCNAVRQLKREALVSPALARVIG